MRIKIMKYLEEILTNYAQDLSTENYKIFAKINKRSKKMQTFSTDINEKIKNYQ